MVEHHSESAAVVSELLGLLHLADDLSFAKHHRIKARGDAESVAGSFFLFESVDMRFEFRERNPFLLAMYESTEARAAAGSSQAV